MDHSTFVKGFTSSRSHTVWYRTYHKLPTISPVEWIWRAHGANCRKCTRQVRRGRRRSIPWNTVGQNNTGWPTIRVTRRVYSTTESSEPPYQLHKEHSSLVLPEIKSKSAFISNRNNRQSTTTGLQDHHYHCYMTWGSTCLSDSSICMIHVTRHGSQEQSSYRLGAGYLCTRTQLKPNTVLSDHSSTQGLPVTTLHLVAKRRDNVDNQWNWLNMWLSQCACQCMLWDPQSPQRRL